MLLGACATSTFALRGNSVDPSANGFVKIDVGTNGNTEVKVRVSNLAPPARLDPNAVTYVVWGRPADGDGGPQNLGALHVGEGERGELDTVTSLHHFILFITVEQSPNPQQPNGPHVLETRVDQS
jgi:hypothetical protein